jgi:hypothetical protein
LEIGYTTASELMAISVALSLPPPPPPPPPAEAEAEAEIVTDSRVPVALLLLASADSRVGTDFVDVRLWDGVVVRWLLSGGVVIDLEGVARRDKEVGEDIGGEKNQSTELEGKVTETGGVIDSPVDPTITTSGERIGVRLIEGASELR